MLTFWLVADSVALVEELPRYSPNLVSDLVGLVNYLICPCPVIAATVLHRVKPTYFTFANIPFDLETISQFVICN